MTGDETVTTDIDARLDALEQESKARREELTALVASLPAATSRRAYLTAMVRGVAEAPDKRTVLRRVVSKVCRTPVDLVRTRTR